MASVNIGQDNQGDAFYRYKMPSLQARIEGRGNGIKTNVVNNVDIAKALERPPDYIIKYFGCELGALTKYEKTTGTSIVNGAHDTNRLKELLEGFIKKYVQCYSCGNPETVVKVRKDMVSLKCKACGESSAVDMRHKLNTFILKNPPEEKVSKAEKKLRKAEKERMAEMAQQEKDAKKKSKKDKKKKADKDGSPEGSANGQGDNDEDDDVDDAEDGDGVVWSTDTSTAAVEKRAAEQLSDAMAGMVTKGNVEAEQEAAVKRAEKEAAAAAKAEEERKAAEEAAAREAAEKEEAAKAEQQADPVKHLRAFIASHTAAESAAQLDSLEVEGGLAGRMRVLYEALFSEQEGKLAVLAQKHLSYLKAAGSEAPTQMAHLIALEHLTGVTNPQYVKETPLVLKFFYDSDLVDESLIIAWHGKKTAGKVLGVDAQAAVAVRSAAEPFITWLEEADEDDSDEDEDE
ncbi:hypothetical protein WJX73_010165 [Symbiochloris irregularis]|uniref:W2 domain-containing protein n=1 Tax=Symbiochloris irregularis TaxID=706552 RepID=A0AAW1PIG2_9CHLO